MKAVVIRVLKAVALVVNINKEFRLVVNVSDIGAGSVLLQEGSSGVDDRVSYFSTFQKGLTNYQKNYSSIEKDCLSVYFSSLASSIVNFSDHNPLTFLD